MELSADQAKLAAVAVSYLRDAQMLRNRAVTPGLADLHRHLTSASSADGSPAGADDSSSVLEDLIDSAEAAAILGCSPRWVTEIRRDLDGRKVGAVYVFRRSVVEEYADARGADDGQ